MVLGGPSLQVVLSLVTVQYDNVRGTEERQRESRQGDRRRLYPHLTLISRGPRFFVVAKIGRKTWPALTDTHVFRESATKLLLFYGWLSWKMWWCSVSENGPPVGTQSRRFSWLWHKITRSKPSVR